jgi:GR25 family glycosyltransferase involved in LPS biosynthesis
MTSSIIDNFFDKIYYINLKKDFDRNINILKEFEKFNIRNFQRMDGVEISDLPDQWLYRSFIKKDFKYIKGALGCRSAHLNIIRDAKNNNYKNIAIFEDDISFTIDPNALIQGNLYNIQNFDLLYFGGLQEQHFNNQIVQTHAMGISCKIFDDILYMAESSGMEIDNFYAKILHHMSYNNNQSGKYNIRMIQPFNTITVDFSFPSNIR